MGRWLDAFKEKNIPETNQLIDIGGAVRPMKKQEPIQPAGEMQVMGNIVRLYRMRPACQVTGYCLGLTQETDCSLYCVRPGWCRERI